MSEFEHKDFAEKCECGEHHDEHFNCIRVCRKKRKFCEPCTKICDCSPKCRPPRPNPCKCWCECDCKCEHKFEHDCRCEHKKD